MTADHPVRPWYVTDPCTCTKSGRAPDLSAAEAARVAEFDAAPVPPEIRVIKAMLDVADELDAWQENAVRYAEHSREDSVTAAMARARVQAYRRATENIRRALDAS